MKNLEDTINKDSTLTDPETHILLGSLAVARNDLAYWEEARNDNSHPWHATFTENLTSEDAKELMLQLSLSSGINFGLIYERAKQNGYTNKDRLSAGLTQASWSIGPLVTDAGDF